MFVLDVRSGSIKKVGGDHDLVALVQRFIRADDAHEFALLAGLEGATASLDYGGASSAILLDLSGFGTRLGVVLPSTGDTIELVGSDVDDLSDQFASWVQSDGASTWADFLRLMNGQTPLAVLSGNPRSTVALLGDSAYRKFGLDNRRSRMGFGEAIADWGNFEFRLDGAVNSVSTLDFENGLWTFDPQLTVAGQFGRHFGISVSLITQYREYNQAQGGDVGIEIALPLTMKRPDEGNTFWQLTPFVQAAGGASLDFAAGGLVGGGGLVSALGRRQGSFDLFLSNEIAYYSGLPLNNIGGYDFPTSLAQVYVKNGLDVAWSMGAGFYTDFGLHLTNFRLDEAAVSWFATPGLGFGWRALGLIDARVAYEADLGSPNYQSNRLQIRLNLFL